MKKILSLGAVLLTAVLLFSGCSNAAGGDGSGDSLPGRWKSSTDTYYKTFTFDKNFWGTVTADGKGSITYKTEKSGYDIFGEDNPAPEGSKMSYYTPNFESDLSFTGFEATASCTSPDSTYGFTFNVDSNNTHKYILFIQNNYFHLLEQNGLDNSGHSIVNQLTQWTSDSAIKAEPNENKVTVYKDGNSIVIKINDKTIHTISDPKYTMGKVGFIAAISGADCAGKRAFTVKYKIEQLQY